MKRNLVFALAVLAATPIIVAAQTPTAVIADIPFSFTIEAKSLPAGSYRFTESASGNEITVTSTSGKTSLMAPVITRVSTPTDQESEVVFDVVGNDHFLSEVFVPGADGYLIKATPVKHTHVKIKAKK